MSEKITITSNDSDLIIQPKDIVGVNVEKLTSQAVSAINNFLKNLNISRIIYVDDKCSINELKDDFLGKLMNLKASSPESELFVPWSLPNPAFTKQISQLWESKNEDEKRGLYIDVLEFEGNAEDIENSLAPLSLKKFLKEKIELLSPTQYVEQKDQLVASLSATTKILFLFDIDFGKAPLADGRTGKDLAQEILNTEAIKDFVYCGIFSHLFSVDEENNHRDDYCKTHGLAKERFYTISKKRFLNDTHLPALAEGIRNSLLIDKVELFKKKAFSILQKAFKKSLAEMELLTPESFNHAIQKSSKKEGVWEVDTLFRLSSIITKSNALGSVSAKKTRNEINQILTQIRDIEKIITGGETPVDRSQIISLRERELFENGLVINLINYPLTNGDIFKIHNKKFILLTQPCNLALRSNGQRTRNYNTGFLVEIIEKSNEEYLAMSFSQRATCGKIEDTYVKDKAIKIAQFATFKTIDLGVLDLAVFNTDGKCRINMSTTDATLLTIPESWKKRYKTIFKMFEQYVDGIAAYKRLRTNKKNDLKKLFFNSGLFKDLDIDNEKSYNPRTKVLELSIERESSYKSPYADDLLQKFMQYLSRNAFDHDFSHTHIQ